MRKPLFFPTLDNIVLQKSAPKMSKFEFSISTNA